MDELQAQVWEFIQALNRTWAVEGKAENLSSYFHPNMVAITATDSERIEGRENCVAGWKQFTDNATIHYWKETDPKVQIYGDGQFAIVTYYYEMSFDMEGSRMDSKGRDMFALVNEAGRWLVVADQFSGFPEQG